MTEPSNAWQNPEDDGIYTNTTSAKGSSIPKKTKTTKSEDALNVFSEGEHGEPLPVQHFQPNFTLDEEDNQNPEDDSIYPNMTSEKWSSIPEKTKTTKSKDALNMFYKRKCGEPLLAEHLQLNYTLDGEDNQNPEVDSIHTNTTSAKWSSILEQTKTTKSEDALSVFSEGECGEPLPAQHLQLNFTPDEKDNEYQQQKCCDFWTFIHSLPQIKHLKVKPIEGIKPSSMEGLNKMASVMITSRVSIEKPCPSVSESSKSEVEIKSEHGVAVSMLERILNKGSCPCTQAICRCKSPKQNASCVLQPLKIMVTEMQEWDAKHPKSMEPPGHPPSLEHCFLQKVVYPK